MQSTSARARWRGGPDPRAVELETGMYGTSDLVPSTRGSHPRGGSQLRRAEGFPCFERGRVLRLQAPHSRPFQDCGFGERARKAVLLSRVRPFRARAGRQAGQSHATDILPYGRDSVTGRRLHGERKRRQHVCDNAWDHDRR